MKQQQLTERQIDLGIKTIEYAIITESTFSDLAEYEGAEQTESENKIADLEAVKIFLESIKKLSQ